MKTAFKTLILTLSLTASSAFATVDGNDRFYMVVEDINGDYEQLDYIVERAPIIGCYGVEQGARLVAWVTPYLATQNVGCGGQALYENINALVCASIKGSVESEDYRSFKEVTLDISKCQDKNNPKFIKAIEATARKNFPQSDKTKSLKLNLIK